MCECFNIYIRSEVTMLERTRVARLQRDTEEMAKEIRDLKDMFQVCLIHAVALSKTPMHQCIVLGCFLRKKWRGSSRGLAWTSIWRSHICESRYAAQHICANTHYCMSMAGDAGETSRDIFLKITSLVISDVLLWCVSTSNSYSLWQFRWSTLLKLVSEL